VNLNWPGTSQPPQLTEDEVHVWAVPLIDVRAAGSALEAILSADERSRARQFVRVPPRRTFVASRAALRSILGRYLGIPAANVAMSNDANGKPRLVDAQNVGDLRFNLAHSGELALVAVALGFDVGADVERLRPVDQCQEIAARYFHPAEQSWLQAVEPERRSAAFLRCWTRKEAVVKALGVGITHRLDGLDVCSLAWVDVPALASGQATRFWFHDLEPCPGYLAAVATARATQPPLGFTYYL
jgi:4'-phosphopantetheinyl transferase